MMKRYILILVLLLVAAVFAFADGQSEANSYPAGRGQGYGGGPGAIGEPGAVGRGAGRGIAGADERFTDDLALIIADAEGGPLSADEERGLLWMYEEEKLARDVYLTLFDTWNHPIFSSISSSEQQHMDSIILLMDEYGIESASFGDEVGAFNDEELQSLYEELTEQGRTSLADAFAVGATIEDVDIRDLQDEIALSDNDDIRIVYQNLMKGSRNHLRSFLRQLDRIGEPYEAQYIEDAYLERVLAISREVAPITDPVYQL